jgi:hypothetical protein
LILRSLGSVAATCQPDPRHPRGPAAKLSAVRLLGA